MLNFDQNSNPTLNELFDLYLELYASSRSPHTIVTKISMWNKHVATDIGTKNVRSLNFIAYQKFLNNLLKTLKPKTVKNIKSDIQAVVKIAVRLGILQDNPLKYIELPKFDNKVYMSLPVDLQQSILKAIIDHDEDVYRNLFLFLAHGRRLNEALSLQWRHVDLYTKTYTIPAPINKAKKSMKYQMTDLLQNAFSYQKLLAYKYDCYSLDSYVFFNPKTKTRYRDIRKAWRRFLRKNNFPKIRLHDLRHIVGSYSINVLNLPIEKVSHTLGHTDIHTTQRYVTRRPENSREVIDALFRSVST